MQRNEDVRRARYYRIDGGGAKEIANCRGVGPEDMKGPSDLLLDPLGGLKALAQVLLLYLDAYDLPAHKDKDHAR